MGVVIPSTEVTETVNANLSLDVGPNITNLIQQLASQIGVTAEKVFPWYIKEAVIDGYSALAICVLLFVISLILLVIGLVKDKFTGETWGCIPSAIGIFGLVIWLVVLCSSLQFTMNAIYNPEKIAMTRMIGDISRLSGK